jgi:hypothetical protein
MLYFWKKDRIPVMKKILLLWVVAMCFSSCEKDDICADETTPLLVIKFFDKNNNAIPKNVASLRIVDSARPNVPEGVYGTFSSNEIKIPLNDNGDATTYLFTLNSGSATLANTDILSFNYTRQQVYVSRACGFKTTYLLNDTDGVLQTDQLGSTAWIDNFTIERNAITTQNETHITIFF